MFILPNFDITHQNYAFLYIIYHFILHFINVSSKNLKIKTICNIFMQSSSTSGQTKTKIEPALYIASGQLFGKLLQLLM